MRSEYSPGEVADVPRGFTPLRTFQDFFRTPGDETPGILIDVPAFKMALDERSLMNFARAMAYGDDDDISRCPVAIVAGAHRSYIAFLFTQLPEMDRAIRVFGTTDEARNWLANRGGA